jgi:hypothetical protein
LPREKNQCTLIYKTYQNTPKNVITSIIYYTMEFM